MDEFCCQFHGLRLESLARTLYNSSRCFKNISNGSFKHLKKNRIKIEKYYYVWRTNNQTFDGNKYQFFWLNSELSVKLPFPMVKSPKGGSNSNIKHHNVIPWFLSEPLACTGHDGDSKRIGWISNFCFYYCVWQSLIW